MFYRPFHLLNDRPQCFAITFTTPAVSLSLVTSNIHPLYPQPPFHLKYDETQFPWILGNWDKMYWHIPHKSFKALDFMHISRCEKLWNIWGRIYVIKTALALALALYKSPQGPETTIKIWDPWTRWWQWPALATWESQLDGKDENWGLGAKLGVKFAAFSVNFNEAER